MKISYGVTVCSEFVEIQRLVDFLKNHKREEDEIVILFDNKNGSWEVEQYLTSLTDNMKILSSSFENNFADWKNYLKEYCEGDYIFFIDADELPSEDLIQTLPEILEINPEMDTFLVPRINTVEGICLSHVKKWGWNISKLENIIGEKELDLNNPQDLDEYNLLKGYNLIIKETPLEDT